MEEFFELLKSNTPLLIVVIVGIVLILGAIIFVVSLVLGRSSLKLSVKDLTKKFEQLSSNLNVQDEKFLRRIENISRTNLLYVGTHNDFSKKYRRLQADFDSVCKDDIKTLKSALNKKNYKALREGIAKTKKDLSAYSKELAIFNEKIEGILRPEEEARNDILECKQMYSAIKQVYITKANEVELVRTSFEEAFKYADEKFKQFDEFIDGAEYEEANTILPVIRSVLVELQKAIENLPELCLQISSVIPENISSLLHAHEELNETGYPVYHLSVNKTVSDINEELNVLTKSIKQFRFDGVKETLNEITAKIHSFYDAFEKERTSKEEFINCSDSILDFSVALERKFIRLRNNIPDLRKYYIFDDIYVEKISSIQEEINKMGVLKRNIDNLSHSGGKAAYSLLLNKTKELDEISKVADEHITDYFNYIECLKNDSESAYKLVSAYYEKTIKAEKLLRDIKNNHVTEKYADKISSIYETLNLISGLLVTPIDVAKVNELVGNVHEIADPILEDGLIYNTYNTKIMAENAILYLNRERMHQTDINKVVNQCEYDFKRGDFEKALQTSTQLLASLENPYKK